MGVYSGEDFETDQEKFNQVLSNERMLLNPLIEKCTPETFVEFIKDESDEIEKSKKGNGYVHYKLPNGLHVYGYTEDFDKKSIASNATLLFAITSELDDFTKEIMMSEGSDFSITTSNQPCIDFWNDSEGITYACYHYGLEYDNDKYHAFRKISEEGEIAASELLTITAKKSFDWHMKEENAFPDEDEQLIDNGFFEAIRQSNLLPPEIKEKFIQGFLQLKVALEKEIKPQESIKLIQTTDTPCRFEIFRIESGTINGVNIPCILALPQNLKGENKLTLVFNNENGQTLNASVENIERELPYIIDGVKFESPIIIPILPSQNEFDQSLQEEGIAFQVGEPKQFARECFSDEIPNGHKFYRLDNQVKTLIKSIITREDIKSAIQSQRTNRSDDLVFSDKLNGFGHSGAGAAMLRFALLHPEMLDTLIIGGNGDIIPTPFGENATELEYPFGIKDYTELLGREFSESDYKGINFQFYIGEREDTNPIYDTIRDENYAEGKTGNNFAPEKFAFKYKTLYGTPFFERFKNVLRQYEQNGYNIGLKIYKDDCHSVIQADDLHGILDGVSYFDSNCSEQLQEMLNGRNKSVIFSEQEIGKTTIHTPTIKKDETQMQTEKDIKDLTIKKEEAETPVFD